MRSLPFPGPKLTGAALLTAAWVLVLAVRLWRLEAAPLPDYDAARNWLTIQEMARGDWTNLFRHASPSWYLLHLPLAEWLAADYHRGLFLNALVGAGAAAAFARAIARWAPLQRPDEALLLLLTGWVTQYTCASRDFSITAPALLVFGLALNAYGHRVRAKSRSALFWTAGLLAFGYSLNYKLLLLLPGLLLLEWLQRADGVVWRRPGTLLAVLAVLAAPLLAYAALAQGVGLPWYRLPATWVGIVWPATPNAAGRNLPLGGDLTFYPRYLLQFESPVLLLGLLAGPWLVRRARRRAPAGQVVSLALVLTLLVAGMLLIFSLVAKAPRGLMFVLGPLVALGLLAVQEVGGPRRRWLPRAVLLLLSVGQLGLLWRELGRYAAPGPPAHAQVARWLHFHGVAQVATTAGLALAPEAARWGIAVVAATKPRELAAAQQAGCRYVLLDGYRTVAGLDSLGAHLRGRAVLQLAEPALLLPLLFLEHAEYTGQSYRETLARQARAAAGKWQLVLLDTRPPPAAPAATARPLAVAADSLLLSP